MANITGKRSGQSFFPSFRPINNFKATALEKRSISPQKRDLKDGTQRAVKEMRDDDRTLELLDHNSQTFYKTRKGEVMSQNRTMAKRGSETGEDMQTLGVKATRGRATLERDSEKGRE